jgi:4-hydroxybenzoate polyprenyltransferase
VRQWSKNFLVLAAPMATGEITQAKVLINCMFGFAAFSLLSSCVYIFNDFRDRSSDRLHPEKRFRPIASQAVSVSEAFLLAFLMLCVVTIITRLLPASSSVVLVIYFASNILYSLGLKTVKYLEIFLLASGFILRAVYGSVITGLEPSLLFIFCILCGASFVVFEKRRIEKLKMRSNASESRAVLSKYSEHLLRRAVSCSGTLFVLTYFLWSTFQIQEDPILGVLKIFSTAPLAVSVRRFHLVSVSNLEDAPEKTILSDRVILLNVCLWAVLIFPF